MGFQFDVSIPAVTVFLQGLISFFSPCVLPLLPLYIGYLSGGTGVRGEDGKIHYHRGKVMVNTVFCIGRQLCFFPSGTGNDGCRKLFPFQSGNVCPDWRSADCIFWFVPAGDFWDFPGSGAGTAASISAG